MTYPYFFDMLDRGRNMHVLLGALEKRVAEFISTRRRSYGQPDALRDVTNSLHYHAVMPTLTRGARERDTIPWWARDSDPDPAPESEGVDVHP
jgi:hypothetical protein